MKDNTFLNQEGFNGSGQAHIDSQSDDFNALKLAITKHSQQQLPEERIENQLLSFQLKMEDYLNQNNPETIVMVGHFLREILKALKIKNNTFAEYIGLNKSNFSALINGKRKINFELALIFSKIFKIKPDIWINIENKNELLAIHQKNKAKYDKYSINDLIHLN